MGPDELLAEMVREALIKDDRAFNRLVSVGVSNGIVTLCGHVPTQRDALVAQEIAASVPGCREVVVALEVKPPEPVPDDVIAENIRAALDEHPDVRREVVVVSVKGGAVTLTGNVASARERALAKDIAHAMTGVRSVRNLVAVDLFKEIEDEALSRNIEYELNHGSGFGSARVRVAVTGDVAQLSGRVTSPTERISAEQIVRRFRVRKIPNDITVAQKDRPLA